MTFLTIHSLHRNSSEIYQVYNQVTDWPPGAEEEEVGLLGARGAEVDIQVLHCEDKFNQFIQLKLSST